MGVPSTRVQSTLNSLPLCAVHYVFHLQPHIFCISMTRVFTPGIQSSSLSLLLTMHLPFFLPPALPPYMSRINHEQIIRTNNTTFYQHAACYNKTWLYSRLSARKRSFCPSKSRSVGLISTAACTTSIAFASLPSLYQASA